MFPTPSHLVAALSFLPSSLASPTYDSPPSIPRRPYITAWPHNPGQPQPCSPPRDPGRYCFVEPGCGHGEDDAPRILAAFQHCNDGGTVVLDKVYRVGSPLDLTFLQHVDAVITGEIHFDDSDMYYWAENSFKYEYQNQSVFWKWGGEDVNIYGDPDYGASLIDGHGQVYWEEAMDRNGTLLRPMLFAFDGMHGAWFNIISESTDIIVSNMYLNATSLDGAVIPNSDGWDTYRSDRVVIQDSLIINTDDCVSFKPNSTNIVIQNLNCTGSHGISVGSLGQYAGEVDIVENLYIYNISMYDASDGARIKVWPGLETSFQPLLNGGGGLGRVKNVTWDTFYQEGSDRAITITQCYGQTNQTLCYEHPSNLTIEDITIKNVWGTTSELEDPQAGTLVCSAPDRCSNIRAENISMTVPSGEPPVYACANLDEEVLDFECVEVEDEERDTSQG